MGKALVTALGCWSIGLGEKMWMSGVRVLDDNGSTVSLLIWGNPLENYDV